MPPDVIQERATKLLERINESDLSIELISGESAIGGGAGPDVKLKTALLAIAHPSLSSNQIAEHFRNWPRPIILRINEERALIDLRTVSEEEESVLAEAINGLSKD